MRSAKRNREKKRIETLSILGLPFQVIWDRVQDDASENYGESKPSKRQIWIYPEACEGEEWVLESTLLHEIIHSILGVAGHDGRLSVDEEERLVTCIESGLYPVLVHLVSCGYFRLPPKESRK